MNEMSSEQWVGKLSTRETNRWELPAAGLNSRSWRALTKAGYRTVGDLKKLDVATLMSIRNISRLSVQHIQDFLEEVKRLEQGDAKLETFRAFLKKRLNDDQLRVLEQRFGLRKSRGSGKVTLAALGREMDVTRERARQLQLEAKAILTSQISRPYLKMYQQYLQSKASGGRGPDPVIGRYDRDATTALVDGLLKSPLPKHGYHKVWLKY
jgi:hypothetical protein